MQTRSEPGYLRLEQFLDLERQWSGADNEDELGHRIATTMSVMLDADGIAIALAGNDGELRDISGRSAAGAERPGRLASVAIKSGRPELRRHSDNTEGAFPFEAGGGRRGALEMTLPSARVGAREISFLRFLAALAGSYLSGTYLAGSRPLTGEETTIETEGAGSERFLAMAAHDLRSPLATAQARLALLAEDQRLPAALLAEVEKVGEGLGFLSRLVEGLLDSERIAGGRLSAKAVPTDLGSLFEELSSSRFPQMEARLRWPEASAVATVRSDPALLAALLGALIDNALGHSGSAVVVSCQPEEDGLWIRVTDQGAGLGPDQLRVLLSTGDAASAQAVAGLGLRTIAVYASALGLRVAHSANAGGGNTVAVGPLQLCQSAR